MHQYGKGYKIMQNMGYKGKGSLGIKNEGLVEPIEMAWRDTKENKG